MNSLLYQLLLSLKLGDGSYITQRRGEFKTYRVQTNSINEDYIQYKRTVFENNGVVTKSIKCLSGYNKNSKIVGFTTHVTRETTFVGNLKNGECILNLDLIGLIQLYLDDGSLHKRKHFMHIYCNSFAEADVNLLIDKIFELFPTKKCSFRWERKKDGRIFPFIYIPVCVAKDFNIKVREFLINNNINSLLYKTFLPSQTIESIDN